MEESNSRPMPTDEAINVLERLAHTESKWPGTEDSLTALDMAINALRRAAPENRPLTLEELKQVDGESVWVHDLTGNKSDDDYFAIISLHYAPQCYCDYDLSGGVAISSPTNGKSAVALALLRDYGKTWLAYRHKPET